jgi:hypothetical protein
VRSTGGFSLAWKPQRIASSVPAIVPMRCT